MADQNRLKITYPFRRRQSRPQTVETITVVSETIVRVTETISIGSPGLFINHSSFCLAFEKFDDPFQRMIILTGSSAVAPPA